MEEKRYSNQQSNSHFQPQTYRQSGFEQVNPGRTETHSSSVAVLSDVQQPLVGVIDQGFGAGEHGTEVLNTIAESNPQSTAWLGGGVGNGNWANSLNKFVDAAKTFGKQAVANLSFDLTEKRSDGSVTTRSQLTTDEQQALSYAQENGVLIVASSGNQGSTMSALGQASNQFDNIIAVGAAEGNKRADYSSYGTGLDLVAAGQQAGDAFTGTSRSAAEVTGTISQMWAANPTLDYRQVSHVLEATATDLQTRGWDIETGAGQLNSSAAVSLAGAITPETQLFSGDQLAQQVNISFNQSPWTSVNGSVASERTNREFEGESVQEDERLRANYRAQTQTKQQPPMQKDTPKAPVNKEKPLNRFEQAEAASIRREQRAESGRKRRAQEKAALTQIARDPNASTTDRHEARSILKTKATAQHSVTLKPPVSHGEKPHKSGGFADADADAGMKDTNAFAEAFAKIGWKTDKFDSFKVEGGANARAAAGTSEIGTHAEVKADVGNNVVGLRASADVGLGGVKGGKYARAGASIGADLGGRLGNAEANGNELGISAGVGAGARLSGIWGQDIDHDGQKEYGGEARLKWLGGGTINLRVEPNAVKARFKELFGE